MSIIYNLFEFKDFVEYTVAKKLKYRDKIMSN